MSDQVRERPPPPPKEERADRSPGEPKPDRRERFVWKPGDLEPCPVSPEEREG